MIRTQHLTFQIVFLVQGGGLSSLNVKASENKLQMEFICLVFSIAFLHLHSFCS